MTFLYLDRFEKDAIAKIDAWKLDALIDEALRLESLGGELAQLSLPSCGPFVSGALTRFQKALAAYRAAKSHAKREATRYDAEKAGRELSFAFHGMKRRLEAEEQEDLLFHVDDDIWEPSTLTQDLSVRVAYRWRKSAEDDWTYGAITFLHRVEPTYWPTSTRKQSRAKRAEALQEELRLTWRHLRDTGLYTLRDYLRENREEVVMVPETVIAKADTDGGLNNHSLRF